VAAEFDGIIGAELARAASPGAGGHGVAPAPPTMTQRLVRERVHDRHLSSADLVSMMRNWTAGELGTIAAAVGIIVEFLARRPDVSELLRRQPRLRQRAIDEMLRLDAPLIRNRRRTTASVAVGDRTIPGDAKVTIVWAAAQRDPDAFTDATEFRLDRDPSGNLLYGRGPHACPGEGLARVELGAFLDEWLDRVPAYEVRERVRARYPSGGFSRLLVAWGQA
jgi:cytochrome P450